MDLCGLLIDLESQILDQLSTAPIGRSLEVIYLGTETSDLGFLPPTMSFQILELGVQAVDDVVQAIPISEQSGPGRLGATELLLQASDLPGRRARGPSRATGSGGSGRTWRRRRGSIPVRVIQMVGAHSACEG
ncbi:hypothetical protein PF008_g25895 [Phytophthora fragariae]|uniref:Uncharacterized protein n=1 Tax=Phytophthora fragariae TaxID=53985 RepID=A0A6G0QJJ8_9STRA|nr:hypothetical protein PF008_g25895 [Phytophthora fragariae]